MAEQKQHLTQEGYDKLLKELNKLKQEDLPASLLRLKEASEQGDISENAEYDDALSVRDLLEARISEIERMIANVEIIKKDTKATNINYGSLVTFAFTDALKEEHTVEIVGSGEVDVDDDKKLRISFHGPIGMALKGAKKGDIVKVRIGGDRKEIKVLAVK
jgi:transcription elongation factor GreA